MIVSIGSGKRGVGGGECGRLACVLNLGQYGRVGVIQSAVASTGISCGLVMALGVNAKFRNGWQRLQNGGTLVRRVRSRLGISVATKAARRGLADLLFPPSCAYCTAELEESTTAERGVW